MAMFEAYPGGPDVDPFGPMPEGAVKDFVARIALILSQDFRVEVIFNSPDGLKRGVKVPFAEIMAGVPDTKARVYSVIALPTWASASQIAGIIKGQVKQKSKGFSWANKELIVKGPIGVFEVTEFSAAKHVND